MTSLLPDLIGALIRPAAATLRARPGESLELAIEVENSGTSTWLVDESPGYGFVKLGAHLHVAQGRTVDFDFLRASLSHDLPPAATALLPVRFSAPATPGNYVLEFDLVNEGVNWFRGYGSRSADVRLMVTAET